MAQAPQEISITYGSFTIDTSNKANYIILDNAWRIEYGDSNATVSFKVLVMGTDEADFFSKETAFREAFRDIRKLLTISLSGSTYYSWTVSGTPHADSVPRLERLDDDHFTNRSCAYSVSIAVVMKAITSRRSENVMISEDASNIRTMTISATYHATASLGAYQSYLADFDSLCTTVITFVNAREGSATWEEVTNPSLNTNTIVNNVLTITRVYVELIFDQSESALNDSDLVDMKFDITFSIPQPGDTLPSQAPTVILNSNPQRPTEVNVMVVANIPKSTTDLESVYEGKIKPYLLAHIRDRGGFSAIAVKNPSVSYNRVKNVIAATFQVVGATQGFGQILSSSVTVSIDHDLGNMLVGAHDGTPFGRWVVPIKQMLKKTISEQIEKIDIGSFGGSSGGGSSGGGSSGGNVGIGNTSPFSPFGSGIASGIGSGPTGQVGVGGTAPWQLNFGPGDGVGGGGGGGASGAASAASPEGWVLMSTSSSTTPKVVGTVTIADENFPVVAMSYTENYVWVTKPMAGSSSFGQGTTLAGGGIGLAG